MTLPPAGMKPAALVITHADLAWACGGSPGSFTANLLRLCSLASAEQLRLLRIGFPEVVCAWEFWARIAETGLPSGAKHATCQQVRAAAELLAIATDLETFMSLMGGR